MSGQFLEDSLRSVLESTGLTGRQTDALLARFGWSGLAPVTLEVAGKQIGVTRERIRQLEKISRQRMRPDLDVPLLPRAIDLLTANCPLSIEEAEKLLIDANICKNNFHPLGLVAAANVLGLVTTLSVVGMNGGQIVVSQKAGHALVGVRTAVRSVIKPWGVFHQHAVEDLIRGNDQSDDVLQGQLTFFGAQSLGEGWWWIRRGKNLDALNRLISEVLSIANELDVGSLKEAINRRARNRKWPFAPPESVLLRYCREAGFVVNEDKVSNRQPYDWRNLLSHTDRTLVEILLKSPGRVMDRAGFWRECSKAGINQNTFSVYVTYSPYIEHLGLNVWGVRGVAADPVAVHALQEGKPPRRRDVVTFSWTPEGALRLQISIDRTSGFVVGIPAAVRRYLADRAWTYYDAGERPLGTINLNSDGNSWGYGPFLSRNGAEPGDILTVDFHLPDQRVDLSLSSEREAS